MPEQSRFSHPEDEQRLSFTEASPNGNTARTASNGDVPTALSGEAVVTFDRIPTDTPSYIDPIRPGLKSEITFTYDEWLPEDNDNTQHLSSSEPYVPDSASIPPNADGIGIVITLQGSSIRPNQPLYNYVYLSQVRFTVPETEENATVSGNEEFLVLYGSFYATGMVNGKETEVELKYGTVVKDYAGNIYIQFLSREEHFP